MNSLLKVVLMLGVLALGLADNAPSAKGVLLVANKGDQTIGIIDPIQGRMVAAIKEDGFTAHEVVASPDGRVAFAPVYGNSGVGQAGTDGRTIDLIDISSRRLLGAIDLGRPARPHCAKFGPDGLLYVSAELADSLMVIDPNQRKVVASISTGQPESHMFALSPDGRAAYTSNVHAGTVSVVDLHDRKLVRVIPVTGHAQRISLSIDGRRVFTSDQDEPRLAVIDPSATGAPEWIPLPGIGYGSAPTLDGRYLLIALLKINKVGVIDLSEKKVVREIEVPAEPQEIVVRPDDIVAYVSCDRSAKVAAINLRSWKVEKLIDAGRGVDGLAWSPLPK